ncbi:hypothetical protein ACFOTA_13400 [Chitinophaga sp. GCM10012297]|uniref:Big-1 domain-containing protein n=1 Tax=Chitinophaga chungangae TaxID=2821488 RepID=A0ABS3YEV7_9BACT|nr:hypothetical protein [Chitinophaga chungangae]MBO9153210.1 hypothetical protein [Chitinophaga chungangae]
MPYKKYLLILLCVFTVAAVACKKKKKGDGDGDPVPPPPKEAELVITMPDIKLNRDDNAAPGATLGVKVNITSTPLPKDGVTITVTALDPAGQPIPQNAPVTVTANTADISLINLPSLRVASIVVTVTSKNDPTNTKTFRFGVLNKVP